MTDNTTPYRLPKEAFNLKQKVGQFFMPAVFINDTEEEVRKKSKNPFRKQDFF